MNDTLPINKKLSTSPSHLSDSDVPFLVVATIFPPTAKIALLFQHRSRTPKFHHLLWHFSESFHQHSNDQTAPGCDTFSFCASVSRRGTNFAATRRIFSLSVKIRWQELLQIPTSSVTLQPVRRRFWQITASTFLNVIVVYWRGRPSRFRIVFDGRCTQFETLVPLVTSRTAKKILSIRLLQHLKVSVKVLPNLKQNLTQTHWSVIFQIAKNRRGC